MQGLDLENKDKRYLDEKELFILYWLLKRKIISTGFSNLFTPNQKFTPIGPIKDFNQIATIEDDISSSYENSIRRITYLLGSPTVPKYLLELGKAFDEKGFKVLGNADYSLVDGGFLSEIDENGKDVYKKMYENAIIKNEAESDFIELVNRLIVKYDGSKWITSDIEKFIEIYFRHNRKTPIDKAFLSPDDNQTQLAKLIFECTDFVLFITKTKILEKYLHSYLSLYINDNLDGKSKNGLTGSFFSEGLTIPFNSQFFGYKKQREILVKYIENKYEQFQRVDLEIGHPFFEPEYIGDLKGDELKITAHKKNTVTDLFLFVHTMLALENENYLTIEDFSFGPKGLFDMYDRGFLFRVRLNNIRRNSDSVKTKTYSKVPSFNDLARTLSFMGKEILISKKEESDPHKLIRTLFKDMSKVWANDEILEDWNYSLSDEDVTKNKAYQAGKAINRTIAQETTVKDFLSITTKSISINNKYLKPYKSL